MYIRNNSGMIIMKNNPHTSKLSSFFFTTTLYALNMHSTFRNYISAFPPKKFHYHRMTIIFIDPQLKKLSKKLTFSNKIDTKFQIYKY